MEELVPKIEPIVRNIVFFRIFNKEQKRLSRRNIPDIFDNLIIKLENLPDSKGMPVLVEDNWPSFINKHQQFVDSREKVHSVN